MASDTLQTGFCTNVMKVHNEQMANTLVTKRHNYFINILVTYCKKWMFPIYFFKDLLHSKYV